MLALDFSRPIPHSRTRASTYARDGSDQDTVKLEAGESWAALFEGAGEVRHIWFSFMFEELTASLSNIQLLAWFDEEPIPQINTPLGDFIGLGHNQFNFVKCAAFDSAPLTDLKSGTINPLHGSVNFWLPMPFARGARFELRNLTGGPVALAAYIDSFKYGKNTEVSPYRFHATYRESYAGGVESGEDGEVMLNTSGEDNYVMLDLKNAKGNYVGSILHTKSSGKSGSPWHEGDDMIFVDDVSWPPTLHGSGTLDYFNLSSQLREPVQTHYHGISHFDPAYLDGRQSERLDGKFSLYRLHLADPIPFTSSILATIEHGHANTSDAIFRSVAYWYGIGHDQNAREVPVDPKARFGNPGRM